MAKVKDYVYGGPHFNYGKPWTPNLTRCRYRKDYEMSNHTPAPWKVTDDVDETVWVSSDNRENVICDVVGAIWDPEAKATQITDEDIANARLIAAAPELLHALQMIFKEPYGCTLCDSGIPRNAVKGHQPDCPFEIARLAVEKAIG